MKIKEIEEAEKQDEIIFGDGQYEVDGEDSGEFEVVGDGDLIYSDSGIDVEAGPRVVTEAEYTPQGLVKREHKREKHWGKKNKKLRDKNPYSDEYGTITGSLAAFSTNRTSVGGNRGAVSNKPKRHDPKQAYGTQYTRPQYPFQPAVSYSEQSSK